MGSAVFAAQGYTGIGDTFARDAMPVGHHVLKSATCTPGSTGPRDEFGAIFIATFWPCGASFKTAASTSSRRYTTEFGVQQRTGSGSRACFSAFRCKCNASGIPQMDLRAWGTSVLPKTAGA